MFKRPCFLAVHNLIKKVGHFQQRGIIRYTYHVQFDIVLPLLVVTSSGPVIGFYSNTVGRPIPYKPWPQAKQGYPACHCQGFEPKLSKH